MFDAGTLANCTTTMRRIIRSWRSNCADLIYEWLGAGCAQVKVSVTVSTSMPAEL